MVEHVPDQADYTFLKHAVSCTGHCPFCKDTKRDQMERTRKTKWFHFEIMTALDVDD